MNSLTALVGFSAAQPESECCLLRFDGGSRGNPGEAGSGSIIVGPAHSSRPALYKCEAYLGSQTNNVAEWTGLIHGMRAAKKLGAKHLIIEGDSELVLKQLAGVYSVSAAHLRPYYDEARSLLASSGFVYVACRHIARQANFMADALCNSAMDKRASSEWTAPPAELAKAGLQLRTGGAAAPSSPSSHAPASSSSSAGLPAHAPSFVSSKTREVLSKLTFEAFTDSFAKARGMRRTVVIYTGPPNSGKTHASFLELSKAKSGAYLAPLRLLALEGRDRLAGGYKIPTVLLTGEDYEPVTNAAGDPVDAHFVSSTVECVDTTREVDVVVIDECQMLFDPSRGWAWTQAIIGVPAKTLILIAAAHAVDAVSRIVAACGEIARVHTFQRKGKLQVLSAPVPPSELQPGDAIVSFSRNDVLRMHDRVASGAGGQSLTSAVVYGALPAEIRRREAERFNSGDAQVLCASDAIGMGLNLPVKRVLFATMSKFDGRALRPLDVAEVHQIGGRAGRFGKKAGPGLVGVLQDSAEPGAHAELVRAMARKPEEPQAFLAPVAPTPWHVDLIRTQLGMHSLHDILSLFFSQMKHSDGSGSSSSQGTATAFTVVESTRLLELAAMLDACAYRLDVGTRFKYASAPVSLHDAAVRHDFKQWAGQHAAYGAVGAPDLLRVPSESPSLDRLEYGMRASATTVQDRST